MRISSTPAELWATLCQVQRVHWMGRARVSEADVREHAGKDWHLLPAKIQAAVGGVR